MFINAVPEFNFCEFKQPPYLARMAIAEAYPVGNNSNTERYRRLKSLAIDSHDHEQELMFFSYEMKSKMENAAHRQSTRTYTPIRLYELTSSFGRSIGKPLAFLVGLFFLSAALNWLVISPLNECKSPSYYSKGSASFNYAANHSVPLLYSDRKVKAETENCLFGDGNPPPLPIQIYGFFQSLFSLIFAFLIGLGIRNRFKIK